MELIENIYNLVPEIVWQIISYTGTATAILFLYFSSKHQNRKLELKWYILAFFFPFIASMIYLSKSKYCSFVQCPKNLWLGVNKPELAVKDPSTESRMEEGNVIGDLAMQIFGDFVEVTALKPDGVTMQDEVTVDPDELRFTPADGEYSF